MGKTDCFNQLVLPLGKTCMPTLSLGPSGWLVHHVSLDIKQVWVQTKQVLRPLDQYLPATNWWPENVKLNGRRSTSIDSWCLLYAIYGYVFCIIMKFWHTSKIQRHLSVLIYLKNNIVPKFILDLIWNSGAFRCLKKVALSRSVAAIWDHFLIQKHC